MTQAVAGSPDPIDDASVQDADAVAAALDVDVEIGFLSPGAASRLCYWVHR